MGPDELVVNAAYPPYSNYRTETYSSLADFPTQGEGDAFYVDLVRGSVYLWVDNRYVEVNPYGPINFDTPVISPHRDTDGDSFHYLATDVGAISVATGPMVQDGRIQVAHITDGAYYSRSDLLDQETLYNILKMWPLYNNNGQVIGLFDTKEHRDEAQERMEQMAAAKHIKETALQRVFKNVSRKTSADSVS